MRLSLVLVPTLLFAFLIPATGQSGQIPVIVDTDAALDDFRALVLLCSIEELDIIGVTVSGGSCSPVAGLTKVRALLQELGRSGTPSCAGPDIQGEPPPWRPFSESISWGKEETVCAVNCPGADEFIIRKTREVEKKITVICLGTLTNLASALRKNPGIKRGIDKVIWYNEKLNPPQGTNYDLAREAADYVLSQGLEMEVVSDCCSNRLFFDEALLESLGRIRSSPAKLMAKIHRLPSVLARIRLGHIKLWDDLIPVYISNPGIFVREKIRNQLSLLKISETNTGAVRKTILKILSGIPISHGANVVFLDFPRDTALLKADLRDEVGKIIAEHGEEEWRACVLTSEIHRHLGIYSLVGAKMGLRAREVFGVGPTGWP